jgi:hypothetical protein
MNLLTKLLCVLTPTVREWDTFLLPDGDVGYFSDLDEFPSDSYGSRPSVAPGQSLRVIKQTFEQLENERQKLAALKDSLARDFSMVR